MESRAKRFEIKRLPNGTLILTESAILQVHDLIIEERKQMGKNDPYTIRDAGILRHLYDTLVDRPRKFSDNQKENALYVATETFYYIACEHPFTEGNKSTAYVCALLLLSINLAPRTGFPLDSTPREAEEIVKLAEGGKEPTELRRLIKEFLQKEIS